ncbi:HlyC/CorC family transporter [Thiorhodococcus mannitoliphagus]|uniref:HlyC/CorC family transporter n=1 Tax=Thiorhodococcus mannitoliphagus TaxID=329406 RepID=A0A6P1E2W5_9GAMM|nr:hemolysin family protein [Thiorhodococcus mannitoliphagus]NEX23416.1 HlyC/CorC family transporter [Thiorhodococcus mannitoliphagus]
MDTWNLELILRGILQALLLGSSAVFSGSETALFSLSRIDLQQLRYRRDPHSEGIHAMLDEPRRLIISILCGNELVNIASTANMTGILLILFGQDAGWINILVMVPLLLLVGEVTPKTIAVNHPLGFARHVSARILPRWIVLVTPLREAVRQVADRVTTLLVGEAVARANLLRADELKSLLEEGEETGIIDATERVLIDNLLEAAETDILHIMTPGPRLCLLDAEQPLPDLIRRFRAYQHPRVPVYSGHWDNVVGFVHSEDVLRIVRGGADLEELSLQAILRPAHFLPPTVKVDELFHFFQEHKTRACIVLGEFGEVLGIVTMKDVLSFIFGELTTSVRGRDECERDGDAHIVPGWMRLLDFYTVTNIDLDDPVMTTVGGLVFRLFGRLPEVGASVDFEGYRFQVLGIDGLRINRVRVSRFDTPGTPETEVEVEPSADVSKDAPPEPPEPEAKPSLAAEGLTEVENL